MAEEALRVSAFARQVAAFDRSRDRGAVALLPSAAVAPLASAAVGPRPQLVVSGHSLQSPALESALPELVLVQVTTVAESSQ